MAVNLTKENYEKEVKQSDKPVVIDVYAEWCGPCKQMMPIFDDISKEHGEKYKFAKLNIDEARELAVEYNVSSVPTFLFVKDGEVVNRETGYMSKNILLEKIASSLD